VESCDMLVSKLRWITKQQVTDTIAAGAKNAFMECEVRVQPLLVRPAVLHRHNRLSKRDQVLSGGPLCCPGR